MHKLLNDINNFISPVSPLDEIDYAEPAALDNRRKEWFEKQDKAALANSLAEIIIEQPDCDWPERKDLYFFEIAEIAGLFGNTPLTQLILSSIVSSLNDPSKRLLIIQVVGSLQSKEGLEYLERLPFSELDNEELVFLVDATNKIGGEQAIAFLKRLKSIVPEENEEVQKEIENALKYPYTS